MAFTLTCVKVPDSALEEPGVQGSEMLRNKKTLKCLLGSNLGLLCRSIRKHKELCL
jgi:hypothetical protein